MNFTTLENDILATLNKNQKTAVTAPCSGVLQIVAGPGTGKTKVLISRVAYLLLHENILPHSIIVTTFTKKAANEMVERLREMLKGTEIKVGNLLIGTFHSICYKIIQRYGSRIDIEGFGVADERDASQILQDVLLKKLTERDWTFIDLLPDTQTLPFRSNKDTDKYRGYDVKKLRLKISHLKATGQGSEQKYDNLFVSLVYSMYQDSLRANRLLDFDDCLLYCHKIISRFPVLSYIEHTFVDEFQDTNEIQLQLMYEFSRGHLVNSQLQHNLTIVGDPDQSIYAFRHAQSGNFDKMRQHYLQSHGIECRITYLKENYRSTSDILSFSEKVMRQQSDRTQIDLRSQTSTSFKPVKGHFLSSDQEARWIAYQIKHLMKFPKLLEYSNIAILVRAAFQTRAIELELTKNKVPYFMVRGKAFWERKEVVAMVDYLRCVANENDRIAYLRCVNFPKRGLGPKAIAEMEKTVEIQQVENNGLLVFASLKEIAGGGTSSSLGPKMRSSLKEFLDIVEHARQELMAIYDELGDNLHGMDEFFTNLYMNSGVQKEFSEDVNCDLNISEVKSQLMDFKVPQESYLPDENGNIEVEKFTAVSSGTEYLRNFLSSVTLYDTDPESKDAEDKPRVAVSTIHGAKGLEWPVVFVPGVSEGLLPASFAIDEQNPESVNEERRCFYVATTRARLLLFVSLYTDQGNWGRRPIDRPSRFLDKLDGMFVSKLPVDSKEKAGKVYEMMGKAVPEQLDIEKLHTNYELCMNACVRGEIEDAPSELGFSTAKWSSGDRNGSRFFEKSSNFRSSSYSKLSYTKSSALSSTSQSGFEKITVGTTEVKAPGKAPAYIPMRPAKSRLSSLSSLSSRLNNMLAQTVSGSSPKPNLAPGQNRAPAYVPVREPKKRRLGTKK